MNIETLSSIDVMPWLLSVLTVWSMYVAGLRKRSAWVIGIANQALWMVWIFMTGQWGLLPATVVLMIVFVRNLIAWGDDGGRSETYKNPPTVVVAMIPVAGRGLVVVRRAIEPVGGLALPGGYQVEGETWQQAAAREVLEETGIEGLRGLRVVDAATVGGGKTNLLFVECDPVVVPEGHVFRQDGETISVSVVDRPVASCFPTHTEQIAAFFERRGEARASIAA